jgi:hypothetical protein
MSIKYTDKSNRIIHSDRLIETCRSRGITAERLFGEKEILCLRASAQSQWETSDAQRF